MPTDAPYNATLIQREDVTDALAVLRVQYDHDEPPAFVPGQFTTLGLIDPDAPPPKAHARRRGPKLIRRAYSIANGHPAEAPYEFYIAKIGPGRLTPRLWDLKPGERLFMDTKIKGAFTLDELPTGKHLVAIGTGTGIAPYLSMLRSYRPGEHWERFTLIESCREANRLAYATELNTLTKEDPTLTYLPTLTREPTHSDWQGCRGRVQTLLEPAAFETHTGRPLDPDNCRVLLCGNPSMIDDVTQQLAPLGFTPQDRDHPDGHILTERYW